MLDVESHRLRSEILEAYLKGEQLGKIKIRPGVGIVSVFPYMTYKHWVALGELVDNSLQSYKDHKQALKALEGPSFRCRVDIDFQKEPGEQIVIRDNAAGIQKNVYDTAFTPAVRRPDLSGIGQFGIGLKSASYWYSNDFTVETQPLGEEQTRSLHFDVAKILERAEEEIEERVSPKGKSEHGTKITLRQLHQGIPEKKTLGKIKNYLASIYREDLRSGELQLFINGVKLEYEAPELLEEPFWPTDKSVGLVVNDAGKQVPGETIYWKLPVDFSLDLSWSTDKAAGRPAVPPRIVGWVGILKNGTSSRSGFALLWRGKVVVGAGSGAASDEDTYRPREVFGAPNLYPFQRIVGELDVSALEVTAYKDSIKWRSGQEEEFKAKLRGALQNTEPHSILKMATNFRSTQSSEEIADEIQRATDAAAQVSTTALVNALKASQGLSIEPGRKLFEPVERDLAVDGKSLILRDTEQSISYFLEVVTDNKEAKMIRTIQDGDAYVISINRRHPFIESFANLPGADLDPVIRLSVAAALAQIKLRSMAVEGWYLYLDSVNEYLAEWLHARLGR